MWYMEAMEYYSATKKEWCNASCSTMDGPGDYRTKSEWERQIPYDVTYTWNLEYDTSETETDSDMENKLIITRKRDKLGVWD